VKKAVTVGFGHHAVLGVAGQVGERRREEETVCVCMVCIDLHSSPPSIPHPPIHPFPARLPCQVVDAVKTGKLSHIFLVGGCDGHEPQRDYYSKLGVQMPKDTMVR
jgi:hydroxylamine reductase (hybrid-cluster protein)